MPKLNVGFVGTGSMAKLHAARVAASGLGDVVAICGRTTDAARAMMPAHPVAAAFNDVQKMLDAGPLDALYVCLPPSAHDGQAELAAGRGIAVMLEKPIALSVARAESIVAAVARAGVVSLVGHQFRSAPLVRRLKALIDTGRAGRATLFQGCYLCNALHATWWRDAARSGGQTFEQALHLYDLALHLFGRPVDVSGFAAKLCHTHVANYSVEDTAASIVRFESGAVASIVSSNCAVPKEWQTPFRVVFENLTAEFATMSRATATFSEGLPAEHFWELNRSPVVEAWADDADPYAAQTDHFLTCVQNRTPTIAPAADGLLGVRLVSAVLASARAGGAVVSV